MHGPETAAADVLMRSKKQTSLLLVLKILLKLDLLEKVNLSHLCYFNTILCI